MIYKRFRLGSISLALCIMLFSCDFNSEHIKPGEIQNFDITPDGDNIVFSWNDNGKMSLFKADIDGANAKPLFNQAGNRLLLANPRCSPDGKTIVFIGMIPQTDSTSIWTVGLNGDSVTQVIKNSSLMIEAIFSNAGDYLYYTQANTFKAYSPIARKAPHEFDIHSLKLKDHQTIRVTNLNSYSLSDIIDYDSTKLVFRLVGDEQGLFFCKKNGSDLTRITVTNDSLNNSTGFFVPQVVNPDNIICADYYQLVSLSLKLKKEKMILPSSGSHFRTIRYNKKLGLIFFTKTDDTNAIHSVKIDGTDYKTIPVMFSQNAVVKKAR